MTTDDKKLKFVGRCSECGQPIYSDELYVKVQTKRKYSNLYCKRCYENISGKELKG